MISHQSLARAQSLVYQYLSPTPTYAWPQLQAELGCEVWVKHENHTPIGAFKVRGGLVYLDELSRSGDERDLVTATRGNHGQSIPYAARLFQRRVKVFVPEGNSVEKNAAMQAWGAELVVHGADFDLARQEAERVAEDEDLHLVPSFHEHLINGVATYAAELFEAADLDAVYVPIGMGSGASAMVAVRDLLGRDTEVIGVVSEHADAMARSIESGQVQSTNSAQTFADGMATRMPHPQAFDVLRRGLARVVRVSDDEIAQAMRLLYRTTHNIAEGAGAAATAALMQEQARQAGRRVGVVLSGGNVDAAWLAQVLAGGTPKVA